jgi:hypothetical protein
MHAPHATVNCLFEIPQLLFCSTLCALCAMRAARAAHSRFVLEACSIHILSEIPQLFYLFAPCSTICALPATHTRAIIARAMRTPTPITCADCPNECLYQFGSRSVQPLRRQRWICSAAHSRSPMNLVNLGYHMHLVL